jgi:hypothetical protein
MPMQKRGKQTELTSVMPKEILEALERRRLKEKELFTIEFLEDEQPFEITFLDSGTINRFKGKA